MYLDEAEKLVHELDPTRKITRGPFFVHRPVCRYEVELDNKERVAFFDAEDGELEARFVGKGNSSLPSVMTDADGHSIYPVA